VGTDRSRNRPRLSGADGMRQRLPDEATPAKGIPNAYRTVVHLSRAVAFLSKMIRARSS
jgi:hypothetical protein